MAGGTGGHGGLQPSSEALVHEHDVVMLDLDGVVYVSGHPVPGAPEGIAAARDAGARIAFITNNASRPPEKVAAKLTAMGVPADPGDVVTSAQAAAHLLRERFGDGARVLMLGAAGLRAALEAEELIVVEPTDESLDDPDGTDFPRALVTGYGPDVLWRHVMRSAVLVSAGLPWVASNTDLSIPTSYGVAPGHGVLCRMLEQFTGVTPTVAGKPDRHLFEETIRRVGGERPLMVGDRLDTDIEGANRAGMPSLLVLTGVTGLPELVTAAPELRPTYLALGLEGLTEAHPAPVAQGPTHRIGAASAEVVGDRLQVTWPETDPPDPADWWRVAVSAAWHHLDSVGTAADIDDLQPPGHQGSDDAG